jgi:hypothetical protein
MDPLLDAAANVVAAAIAYVDSQEPGETKDLLFSLESAVIAYQAAVPGTPPVPQRYRCWTCKEPIVRGDRCVCGRGWFVELVT